LASKAEQFESGGSWLDQNSMRARPKFTGTPYDTLAARRAATVDLRSPEDIRSNWLSNAKITGPVNCVYFIRFPGTDHFKIGCATDAVKRLSQLNSSTPLLLELCAWISFMDKGFHFTAEKRAHHFGRHIGEHLNKEWYVLDALKIRRVMDAICYEMPEKIMSVSYTGSW
jgi:Meiotically Up-regulated Gene 113 (MUG113) protein